MGGIGIIFFVAAYIYAAVWLFKRAPGAWLRGLVLALAVLIPAGDAVVGRIQLKHLCETEGGVKVFRVADHVEGLMDIWTTDYWVAVGGYQFVEGPPIKGLVTRYSRKNGQIVKEDRVFPISQYRVVSGLTSFNDNYLRDWYAVETTQGEVLATDTRIAFKGGVGRAVSCKLLRRQPGNDGVPRLGAESDGSPSRVSFFSSNKIRDDYDNYRKRAVALFMDVPSRLPGLLWFHYHK